MTGHTCRMRYVSNAGLVLETEAEAIGIDLFSRDPAGLYPDTPPGLCEELLEEIGRGKIRALIFTHEHGDHFCREKVWEALGRRPGLPVLSTKPVIQTLEYNGRERQNWSILAGSEGRQADGKPGENNIYLENGEKECRGLYPVPAAENGEPWWVQLGPFRIGFLYTAHEGAQYAEVANLTLLLEAAGRHFVVPGDAAASQELFARIRAWSPTIDWFFLPFPYVGLRSSRRMLAEALEIRRAFVLHQPRPEADTQNWVKQAKMVCSRSQDGLPKPVFPEKLGEWYEL